MKYNYYSPLTLSSTPAYALVIYIDAREYFAYLMYVITEFLALNYAPSSCFICYLLYVCRSICMSACVRVFPKQQVNLINSKSLQPHTHT